MGSRRRGIASSTLPKKIKMEIQLALLLLAATGVLTQDEDPAAGGDEVCDKQCEESWEYVEFLKEEISTPVTDILTNFKTTLDGEKAVESTMQGVGINKQKRKQLTIKKHKNKEEEENKQTNKQTKKKINKQTNKQNNQANGRTNK